MNEEIKLAIEGYNQEKIEIQNYISNTTDSAYRITDAYTRLKEIDQAILALINKDVPTP